MTMGADRPPYGARHRKFWPFSAHFSTRPVSLDTPSPLGPRASGQSPIATRLAGACAEASHPAATTSPSARQIFLMSIGSCLSPHVLKFSHSHILKSSNLELSRLPAAPRFQVVANGVEPQRQRLALMRRRECPQA